jgi:hypothetical protein
MFMSQFVESPKGFVPVTTPLQTTSEFEINPKRQFDIKTTSQTPKLAYEQLCREVEKAIAVLASYAVSDATKRKKVQHLRECLYGSVRLPNWEYTTVNEPAEAAYQMFFLGSTCYALATAKTVEITKGLRHFPVADGLEAQALFNAIGHARGAVSALREPVDDPALDEEFFQPGETTSAQLDAVLEDEETGRAYSDAAGSFVAQEINARNEHVAAEAKCTNCGNDPFKERDTKDEPAKAMLPTFPPGDVMARIRSLQGRVLTIVEAIIADKAQREAAKTLVNKEFRRELSKVNWLETEED